MKLYKYLPKEYALQMVNEGIIRIGTLYEFRQYEDKQRGDDMEGRITIETVATNEVTEYTEQEKIPGNFRNFIQLCPGAKLVLSGGAKATIPYNCPDVYIYCCATSYSPQFMQDLKCNSCIEIHDQTKFLHVITEALLHRGLTYGVSIGAPCVYKGHLHDQEEGQSPQWLKDRKYEHQKEYRVVFPPLIVHNNHVIPLKRVANGFHFPKEGLHERPLAPVILRCEGIKSCVRLLE